MSKKFFTEKDVDILSNNKYTKKVTSKAITYTSELNVFLSLKA